MYPRPMSTDASAEFAPDAPGEYAGPERLPAFRRRKREQAAQADEFGTLLRGHQQLMAELFDLLLELVILLTHVHEIEIAVPRPHDRILHHAHRFEDDTRGFEPCVGREVIEDMGALVPAVHTEIHQQGESGNQQDVLGRHALSGEGPADRRRNPEEGGDEPVRRTGREPGWRTGKPAGASPGRRTISQYRRRQAH